MKFILVEINYELNKISTIIFNTVRKIKKKYYIDILFKINYQGQDINDIICQLTKKANLSKLPLIVNYNFDTLSFLNLVIPKMNNVEILKNIDSEINTFIDEYKIKYNYDIVRINHYNYRVVLYQLLSELEKINKSSLRTINIKKTYDVVIIGTWQISSLEYGYLFKTFN